MIFSYSTIIIFSEFPCNIIERVRNKFPSRKNQIPSVYLSFEINQSVRLEYLILMYLETHIWQKLAVSLVKIRVLWLYQTNCSWLPHEAIFLSSVLIGTLVQYEIKWSLCLASDRICSGSRGILYTFDLGPVVHCCPFNTVIDFILFFLSRTSTAFLLNFFLSPKYFPSISYSSFYCIYFFSSMFPFVFLEANSIFSSRYLNALPVRYRTLFIFLITNFLDESSKNFWVSSSKQSF